MRQLITKKHLKNTDYDANMDESWFEIISNEDFESAMFCGCTEFFSLVLKDVLQQMVLHYGNTYFGLSRRKIRISSRRALASVFLDCKLGKTDFSEIKLGKYYFDKCVREMWNEKYSEVQQRRKTLLEENEMMNFMLNYRNH
jgi:hypothetical protein